MEKDEQINMQSSRMWLDRLIGRLLFVDIQPADNQKVQQRAERAFSFSLIFSGVRCILQYAVLPFVLPLVGIAAETATPILLIINLLAIVSIFYSLRRFWQIGYTYRWQYLGVALVALVILTVFITMDVRVLIEQ
jgi:hypothetical protein